MSKPLHHSPVHKAKFKKNLAVLGILVGLIALIFAISIIKMHINTP